MQSDKKAEKCREFSKLVSQYAEGDLPPSEAAEWREHVEGCRVCAAKVEAHTKMVLLLESAKDAEPPWDLELRVLEALGFGGAREQLRGQRVPPPLVWAAVVAAMILAGVGGLAAKDYIARGVSLLFGQAAALSSGEAAGLAGRITGYLVTVWDGILSGLATLAPLARNVRPVLDAAGASPEVIGGAVMTAVLLFVFFRTIVRDGKSQVAAQERRNDVRS